MFPPLKHHVTPKKFRLRRVWVHVSPLKHVKISPAAAQINVSPSKHAVTRKNVRLRRSDP